MFTGIIEAIGTVAGIRQDGSNVHFTVQSAISHELKVDQSLSHNGVCLTVVAQQGDTHTVTAVAETLLRSNLGDLQIGDMVNLERAMRSDGRLDGHIVQGHVDTTGVCTGVETLDGSWYFHFAYEPQPDCLLVSKGSVCINGVSLTVVNPTENAFSVAIIPYTFEHTNFKTLHVGQRINIEFDIIGKYIAKYQQVYASAALPQNRLA